MEAAIGIDVGGTGTQLALVREDGVILDRVSFPTDRYSESQSFIQQLLYQVNRLEEKVETGMRIMGIGIGAPACNSRKGTIEYAANLPFELSFPLARIFEERSGYPTRLMKDSGAAALGEKLFGGAKDFDHFIVITLGTGLGSGIMVKNEIVTGAYGYASEFGHSQVPGTYRQCGCGKTGCLETYASASGLKRTAFELMAFRNTSSPLRRYSFLDLGSEQIYQAALEGDPIALEIFEQTGKVLGASLANLAVTLEPEAIFLAGGLAQAGDILFKPVEKHLHQNIFPDMRDRIRLLPSRLGHNESALLGAASLIFKMQPSFTS